MYSAANIPVSLGWVKKLSAADAVAQLRALDIQPMGTLEENRVLLANHIRSLKSSLTEAGETGPKGPEDESPRGVEGEVELGGPSGNGPRLPHLDGATQADCPLTPTMPETQQPQIPLTDTLPTFTTELTNLMNRIHGQTLQTIAAMTQNKNDRGWESKNSLSEIIKQIQVNTGADRHSLIGFLGEVNVIIGLNLATDREVILALVGKTGGALRAVWLDGVATNLTWGALKERIIGDFFPARERRTAINELVYRLQRPDETLRQFVHDIRQATDILLPDATEQETVQTIVQQINPITRSHLAMQSQPGSFRDLERLAAVSAERGSADAEFARTFPEQGGGVDQRRFRNERESYRGRGGDFSRGGNDYRNRGGYSRGWGEDRNFGDYGNPGYHPRPQAPGFSGMRQPTRPMPHRPQPWSAVRPGYTYDSRRYNNGANQQTGNGRGGPR